MKNKKFKFYESYPENILTQIFVSKKKPHTYISEKFKQKKALDLGCGNGRNIHLLKSLGFKTYGLEIKNYMVKKLKKNISKTIFKVGTSDNIPFKNNFFNYIIAYNSIYYLSGINKKFADNFIEIDRVLKVNGYIIFTEIGEKHYVRKKLKKINHNVYQLKNLELPNYNMLICKKIEFKLFQNNYKLIHKIERLVKEKKIYKHIIFYIYRKIHSR